MLTTQPISCTPVPLERKGSSTKVQASDSCLTVGHSRRQVRIKNHQATLANIYGIKAISKVGHICKHEEFVVHQQPPLHAGTAKHTVRCRCPWQAPAVSSALQTAPDRLLPVCFSECPHAASAYQPCLRLSLLPMLHGCKHVDVFGRPSHTMPVVTHVLAC